MPWPVTAEITTAPGMANGQLVGFVGSEVGLVEHHQLGDVARPYLAQDEAHGLHLALGLRRRTVDQVHEQVGLVDHLEGAAEGLDQLVGQLAHETDRVGHEHGLAAGQGEAPGTGIERGEQPLVGHDARPRQQVEQRRLAGVGVADQDTEANRLRRRPWRWRRRRRPSRASSDSSL